MALYYVSPAVRYWIWEYDRLTCNKDDLSKSVARRKDFLQSPVFRLLAFSRNEQLLVASADPMTQLNIQEDLNLHQRFHCLGLFVRWKMLENLCSHWYCKTDVFLEVSVTVFVKD